MSGDQQSDAIAHLIDFMSFDRPSIPGQDWQLDDESGAPYVPWRLPPSLSQIHEWQAELATVIDALSGVERWAPDWRREMLARVLLEPGLTLPYSIRMVRELVQTNFAALTSD